MSTPRTDGSAVTPTPAGERPALGPNSRSGGFGWLLALAPVLCCGGPLLIAAAATLGALAWGALGAVVALVAVTAMVLARRRSRRCCEPATGSRTQPSTGSTAPGGTVRG